MEDTILKNQLSRSTSLSLLRRIRLHDAVSWSRFAKLYTPLVFGWVRRAGLQDSDAADVTQEVFVVVARRIDIYDEQRKGASFRGWLWGIVRNKMREVQRRRFNEADGAGGTDAQRRIQNLAIEDDNAPPDADDVPVLARRALDLIKSDFSEQTWEIFWRVTMVGDKPADIAEQLGISVGSVYTAKSRVLTHLRRELEGLD